MKIRALYLVLLLAISSTIAAQQAGDTIALKTDESITPPQQQTWWNKKLLHKGYKGHLEFFTEPYFTRSSVFVKNIFRCGDESYLYEIWLY